MLVNRITIDYKIGACLQKNPSSFPTIAKGCLFNATLIFYRSLQKYYLYIIYKQ